MSANNPEQIVMTGVGTHFKCCGCGADEAVERGKQGLFVWRASYKADPKILFSVETLEDMRRDYVRQLMAETGKPSRLWVCSESCARVLFDQYCAAVIERGITAKGGAAMSQASKISDCDEWPDDLKVRQFPNG